MLSKLIKHEFKATYRIFLPIYIGLAIITGFASAILFVTSAYENTLLNIAFGFGMVIVVLSYIFVVMSPYIFLSLRFYRTTATREAYLTFTVPADTKVILLAKFIVSLAWTLLTLLLWFLSLIIFMSAIQGEGPAFSDFFSLYDSESMILQILTIIISIANSILTIFAAISLSQLVRDHRIIASFAFYAAIYTVQQIISVCALLPFMFDSFTSEDAALSYSTGMTFGGIMSSYSGVYIISYIISLGISTACFFLSNYMLKKKLNLL